MREKLIFSTIELELIQNYLRLFATLKNQYAIFKYINNVDNRENTNCELNHSLSQALFRHIIMELYGLFFDDSKVTGEVTYSAIIRKLKTYINTRTCTHKYQAIIEFQSIDDGSIESETIECSFTIEPFIEEMKLMEDTIKTYRHKILAHKYGYTEETKTIEFEYRVTSNDLESLMKLCEQILLRLFKVAFPQKASDGVISYYIKDKEIFNFFNNLVEPKCGQRL